MSAERADDGVPSAASEESIVHAACVSWQGCALLITGASGSGKSGLALQLMAYGAHLVADDRTIVRRAGDRIIASAPESIAGMIEARGVGILNADCVPDAEVAFVVDLDQQEANRLPHPRHVTLLQRQLPLYFGHEAPHFAAAMFQLLRKGRNA